MKVVVTKRKTRLRRSTQYRWTAYADNGRKIATSGESYSNLGDLMDTLGVLGLADSVEDPRYAI